MPRGAKKPSAAARRAEKTRSLVGGQSVDDYRHGDKRKNIPGSGQADYDTAPVERKKYQYDPHMDPQLVWAGKAERTSFEVDTVSLHIHERISTQAILRAAQSRAVQRTLFNDPAEELKPSQRVEFYKHDMGWTNRLILGDSLVVMNSLLEREGMAGKVQMVYVDPPYGIAYNSNFQPSTASRDVVHGEDESVTREPEQVTAYRDTWTLGIHSYLSYLRDRLLLAHKLLAPTGSIFVQINDINLHHVKELLDEVFGAENYRSVITFRTAISTNKIFNISDYLLWYFKDSKVAKVRQLYLDRPPEKADATFNWVKLKDGSVRPVSSDEIEKGLPKGARRFKPMDLYLKAKPGDLVVTAKYSGKTFKPPPGIKWSYEPAEMARLADEDFLVDVGGRLYARRYEDDFPFMNLTNLWTDTATSTFSSDKVYVVQTNTKVIHRCMLMTTDPGDLVLDPTCGSGSTAFVAEQVGRRWVTIDTSRVAVSLARQRLLTAKFPFYRLQNPDMGVKGGFEFETADRVTLSGIAQGEPPKRETLYDKPLDDAGRVRVTGPFSLEAIPKFSITEAATSGRAENTQANVANLLELLRKDGVTFKGGKKMAFSRLTPTSGGVIHAEGEAEQDGKPIRVAVSIGPMHGPVTVDQMIEATNELSGDYKLLVFVGFSFDPECFAFRDKRQPKSTRWEFAHAAADILVGDLLKNKRNDQLFTVFGDVDAEVHKEKGNKFSVEVHGLDIYDPTTGEVQSTGAEDTERNVAAWFLDTNYDRNTFLVCQVFFPAQGREAWEKLERALKGTIDEDKWEQLSGLKSLPFEAGDQRRVAVKVIDHRGNEIMRVMDLPKG